MIILKIILSVIIVSVIPIASIYMANDEELINKFVKFIIGILYLLILITLCYAVYTILNHFI